MCWVVEDDADSYAEHCASWLSITKQWSSASDLSPCEPNRSCPRVLTRALTPFCVPYRVVCQALMKRQAEHERERNLSMGDR